MHAQEHQPPEDTLGARTGLFSRDEIREQVHQLLMHPSVVTELRRIEAQRRHWYWRIYWRLRYLPAEMLGWLMEHTP